MRILVLDSVNPILINLLRNEKFEIEENFISTKQEIENKLSQYEGIIIRSRFILDKEFINKRNNLKFIARVGAGLENIDIDFAEKKGIKIINSAEGNKQAVGEHTLGLLLSLTKNITKSNNQIKDSNIWEREGNRGFEILGKTIGIIGYGNMGSSFAKCVNGLTSDIISYDIKKNYSDNYTKEVSLEEIYKRADIVSIHTPLTELTNQMCNDDFFQNFKKNIWFINTARGKIVNTKSLIKNIKSGKIKGAGLDVLEFEKTSFENINSNQDLEFLKNDERVILTSHIAGWSFESNEKMSEIIYNKILKIIY